LEQTNTNALALWAVSNTQLKNFVLSEEMKHTFNRIQGHLVHPNVVQPVHHKKPQSQIM
jgi:hypothetical protein